MADPWAAYGPIATRSDARLAPQRFGLSETRAKPTLRDRTVDFLTNNFYGEEGRDKAERVADVLDWTPPYMAYNTGRSLGEAIQGGDYQGAATELAMSALPAPAKKGVKAGVRAVEEKLGRIATGEPAKIRAFHGSPHDFDRFDLGRIGTGEGAQAYGHGLYFAENEGVARDYQKQLAGKGLDIKRLVSDAFPDRDVPQDAFPDLYQVALHGSDDPLKAARSIQARRPDFREPDMSFIGPPNATQEKLAAVISGIRDHNRGRMYEVEINADPAQFLDWDAPLSQQPQAAQQVASDIWHGSPPPLLTGKDIYDAQGFKSRADSSEAWKNAGIPGIKYLDQGSRAPKTLLDGQPIPSDNHAAQQAAESLDLHGSPEAAIESLSKNPGYRNVNTEAAELLRSGRVSRSVPNGTRNYVVFDDKLINIVKKYGIAGALAAGAISQMQADQLTEQGYH